MKLSEIEALRVGERIARSPAGYHCKVLWIDRPGKRVRILDNHSISVFWVSYKTLLEKWKR